MLAGYDSPTVAYPVSGPAAQGVPLIQTLARVNRTSRGKQDGLLANRLVKAEVNPGPLNLSRGRGGVYRFHDAAGRCTVPPPRRVPP